MITMNTEPGRAIASISMMKLFPAPAGAVKITFLPLRKASRAVFRKSRGTRGASRDTSADQSKVEGALVERFIMR